MAKEGKKVQVLLVADGVSRSGRMVKYVPAVAVQGKIYRISDGPTKYLYLTSDVAKDVGDLVVMTLSPAEPPK